MRLMLRWPQGIARRLVACCAGLLLCSQVVAQQPVSERQLQGFSLAIKANDFSFLARMDRLGLGVETRDSLGNNLLMIGIREDGLQMVMLMLEEPRWQAEPVINHENQLGESALMLAALGGHEQVLRRLIALGAQVNREGWSALHYAATSGHEGAVRALLEHHAYVDAESPNQTTPLMMAARFNHTAVAKLLVKAGADPTITNEAGFKARDYAADANNKDLEFFLRLEEITFENRYLNTIFPVQPSTTLEEIVIQSGGSVVVEPNWKPSKQEVGPGGGAEVFQGIR
jgi:uncharacterized protein